MAEHRAAGALGSVALRPTTMDCWCKNIWQLHLLAHLLQLSQLLCQLRISSEKALWSGPLPTGGCRRCWQKTVAASTWQFS